MTNTLIAAAVIGWLAAAVFAFLFAQTRKSMLAERWAMQLAADAQALVVKNLSDSFHRQVREILGGYQALVADTPARGQDGKFVERE